MRTNQDYKNAALAALKGNWPQAIVATFLVLVLDALLDAVVYFGSEYSTVAVIAVSVLLMFFLVLPLLLGYINSFSLMFYRSDREVLLNVKDIAFRDYFMGSVGMMAMILVSSVCSLLLVVPGIIASYALFLTPYILKDNPELSIMETLRLSRKMMEGHKMQLFKLQLSFLGWILLSVLTLGVGLLWLMPYMMTAMAAFYQDVREQYIMKEGQQESAS